MLLLRIVGAPTLFALVAVMMPTAWMAATRRWPGLGEMPTGREAEYQAACSGRFCACRSGPLTRKVEPHDPFAV